VPLTTPRDWKALPLHPDGSPFFGTQFLFDNIRVTDDHNAWATAFTRSVPPASAILRSDGREWTVSWDSLTQSVRHWQRHVDGWVHVVDVASVNNHLAWAVGLILGDDTDEPLLLRWNGKHWRQITVPRLAGYHDLGTITTLGDHDLWLAGEGVLAHARSCT
jgi:hypothetical protein